MYQELPTFDEIYNSAGAQEVKNLRSLDSYESTNNLQTSFSNENSAISTQIYILKSDFWQAFAVLNASLSLIFLAVAFYAIYRIILIRLAEKRRFDSEPFSYATALLFGTPEDIQFEIKERNFAKRWSYIENAIKSDSPDDWKMAVLEADIMLDEALTHMGYEKGSIADKLKQISATDLPSIELAWSAHKLRNKIAHEGSKFKLEHEHAKSAIFNYSQVLKEVGLLK